MCKPNSTCSRALSICSSSKLCRWGRCMATASFCASSKFHRIGWKFCKARFTRRSYRLEHQGWIRGEWGESENKRKAKYYRLTACREDANCQAETRQLEPPGRGHDRHPPRIAAEGVNMLARLRSWLRSVVFRLSRMESDMDTELHWHFDEYVERLIQSGPSPCRSPAPGAAGTRRYRSSKRQVSRFAGPALPGMKLALIFTLHYAASENSVCYRSV